MIYDLKAKHIEEMAALEQHGGMKVITSSR